MKKILCLILSGILLCPMLFACVKESPEPVFVPPTVAPEDREKTGEMEYMGLHFHLYNDYTCELAGTAANAKLEKVLSIPGKCEDYTLVRIMSNAFENAAFTEISIPDTVTVIDDYAFRKSELHSVTLPSSLKTLGVECFDNCLSLEKVTFQSGV
ncbi:MAG: leucine-rich repeat domain-containing protein, partial [Clostridia bacterium]|nr:leucine-rich repeat domain-containing protein [Clostridia bacterium]